MDDNCDLCGDYIDPIGGDLAVAYNLKLWCGICHEDKMEKVALWLYRGWPAPSDSQ